MKSFDSDIKLRKLLRNVKPESPGPGFSADVMNRILREQTSLEQIKKEPFFGKGFWIIFTIFILLAVVVLLFPAGSAVSDPGVSFLPEFNIDKLFPSYKLFFSGLKTLPAGVSGILLSTSLLVLLESFFVTRMKPE
ncbi:MAG: hypothetical protein PHH93_06145 [Prolixibacteraceae bacterium]|nr:hypothetical protein [Prolixibacteraceae bacterium]